MQGKIKSLYHFLSPKFQTIHFEYQYDPRPRYGHGKPAHPLLYEIIDRQRAHYEKLLHDFLVYSDNIQSIKKTDEQRLQIEEPVWNNEFLPGLDIIGIYGMLSHYRPKRYIEIGSGNSTKVARKAIREQNLQTEIISIDPYPRADIDKISDKVIRQPFENLEDNWFIVDTLQENDILFIDNSHRVFPNSDATLCFLELLPNLKKGVIVHIHDIYLPYDYPQFMCDRFYNEQYMLAAFLLANPNKYIPILPNFFISEDEKLSKIIASIWEHPNLQGVEQHGRSFWLQIWKK
jgi:hypothetical protein